MRFIRLISPAGRTWLRRAGVGRAAMCVPGTSFPDRWLPGSFLLTPITYLQGAPVSFGQAVKMAFRHGFVCRGPAALAGTASGAAAGQAATPRCTTAGLVVWMDTNGNGAAGSIFYTLKFTNLSAPACTLSRHPGLIAVSLNGARIGHAARWDPPAPSLVSLANAP